jgi:hypothetical protein
MYKQKSILNDWKIAVLIPIFRKVTEETLIITEQLVFLAAVIRYTLKQLIYNCRVTQNSLLQKNKMDSVKDFRIELQHFASKF